MLQRGIRQWSPGDLSAKWIEVCIGFGVVSLVSHDDRLVGSVTVVWDDPLIWGAQPESAGYIHMLMVDRAFAGHGIGRLILAVRRKLDRRGRTSPCAIGLRRGQPVTARLLRTRGLSLRRDQDVPRPRVGRCNCPLREAAVCSARAVEGLQLGPNRFGGGDDGCIVIGQTPQLPALGERTGELEMARRDRSREPRSLVAAPDRPASSGAARGRTRRTARRDAHGRAARAIGSKVAKSSCMPPQTGSSAA